MKIIRKVEGIVADSGEQDADALSAVYWNVCEAVHKFMRFRAVSSATKQNMYIEIFIPNHTCKHLPINTVRKVRSIGTSIYV